MVLCKTIKKIEQIILNCKTHEHLNTVESWVVDLERRQILGEEQVNYIQELILNTLNQTNLKTIS